MRNKLSITIITKNEEANIERCLNSVKWADEIVIIDSGSQDRTVQICQEFGAKVIETKWLGFGKTKKLAVDSAKYDWIFSIDADEEVTEELKVTIAEILSNPKKKAYSVKRKSYYLGKMINYCGWDKDYPLRLFNRKYGNFNEKIVHESVVTNGNKGRIEDVMLHYTYPTISSHIQKIDHYSRLGAEKIAGEKSSISKAYFRGIFKFMKMYFLQKGFLDGKVGFILSLNSAYGVFLKYLKLWEINRSK